MIPPYLDCRAFGLWDIWISGISALITRKRPAASLSAHALRGDGDERIPSSMVVLPETYHGTDQRTTEHCFAISERRLPPISVRKDTTLRQHGSAAQQKNLPSPHCNAPDSESRAHRIFDVAVRLSLVL
jgi:hypothetical protein